MKTTAESCADSAVAIKSEFPATGKRQNGRHRSLLYPGPDWLPEFGEAVAAGPRREGIRVTGLVPEFQGTAIAVRRSEFDPGPAGSSV